ncbi:MAG: DNA-binding response regulator [Flavobacterium sp.]|nr:MAG: DNA-binding response regulator [Flavobacterium sp.]
MSQTRNICVSIVEDDGLIRSSLTQIINNSEGFKVTGAYTSAENAIDGLSENLPDVLLLDIDLPGISGIEALPQLTKLAPDLNIVMLTVHEDSTSVFNSLQSGAVGYLVKSNDPQLILSGIREVYEGGAPMSPSIARKIIDSFRPRSSTPLSEREIEVLEKLCGGANNKKIAEDLFVSTNTVKAHIKNIYKKLHVHNRAEAVSTAIRKKLI